MLASLVIATALGVATMIGAAPVALFIVVAGVIAVDHLTRNPLEVDPEDQDE